MAYDLVIEGGTIVDGTGAPPVRGDVAVQGARIVAVDVDLASRLAVLDDETRRAELVRAGRVFMEDSEHTGQLAGTVLRSA